MDDATGPLPNFIGRGETVATLFGRFRYARTGTGGVTLLIGDTGVGKSTLVAHLAREVRSHGVRVLAGRAAATDDPPPYSLLQSALASAPEEAAVPADESVSGGGEQYLLGFAPLLTETPFAAPIGIEARLLALLGASDARGRVTPDEILAGMAERFLDLTHGGPTVLILDDLDRADGSSLAAVEFFVAELRGRPLWILGTSRPYGSLSEAGRARLESFEAATHADRLSLPALTSSEVSEFLRLHEPNREFTPEEIERRFSETGGNPLLLQQIDRRPAVGRDDRTGGEGELPPLDASAQGALDMASVLGSEFPFSLLLDASGEEEEHLAEEVEQLVGQGVLFERPGELLEFPIDRVREKVYARLGEGPRRVLHRRAGEALESTGSSDSRRVFALARHFYLGREARRSARYNRIAAEVADRSLAPDVAREHLTRALESYRELPIPDRSLEWELVLELARVNYDLGRLDEAEQILRDFLAHEPDGEPISDTVRATLEVFLAQAVVARGDHTGAAALARKVLASPGLESEPLLLVGAHHQLGLTMYYQGDYANALVHHAEEIRLAERVGNERVIAHARLWRAGLVAMTGHFEPAIAEAREVAAALDRSGSVRESGQGHLFLGNILVDSRAPGHRAEAIVELTEAIRLAEKAQDPRRVGWAHYHLAELHLEAGRLDDAGNHARPACEVLGRIGDRTGLCMSLKVRAQIATAQGDFDRADLDLHESLRIIEGLDQAMIEVEVRFRRAQLAYARGDRTEAVSEVADLDRRHLATLRVDLAEEFALLRANLAPDRPAPPPP